MLTAAAELELQAEKLTAYHSFKKLVDSLRARALQLRTHAELLLGTLTISPMGEGEACSCSVKPVYLPALSVLGGSAAAAATLQELEKKAAGA